MIGNRMPRAGEITLHSPVGLTVFTGITLLFYAHNHGYMIVLIKTDHHFLLTIFNHDRLSKRIEHGEEERTASMIKVFFFWKVS